MKRTFAIGIAGPKRSGKDTAATILRQCLSGYDAELYVGQAYFADPMYQMLEQFIDPATVRRLRHSDAKDTEIIEPFGCTLRHMAQTIGTDWARNHIHPDAWVMSIRRQITTAEADLPEDADAAVVMLPDVRFDNEAAFVRENGLLIHIDRPDLGDNADTHASEDGVSRDPDDIAITNTGTITEFQTEVYNHGNGTVHDRITASIHASGRNG